MKNVQPSSYLLQGEPALSGEHIREGLGAVVSVKVPNPEFEGQTKTRLGNPEVKRVVEAAVLQVRSTLISVFLICWQVMSIL